ncbi:Stress responsive alpha-beta barrel, partial [Sesbania bispinosa]
MFVYSLSTRLGLVFVIHLPSSSSGKQLKIQLKSVSMGFAFPMQCSTYGYSICVPHRFARTPLSFHAYHCNGFKSPRKNQRTVLCAAEEPSFNLGSQRKRKVVEHVCLLKAKEDLSEEEENDMLDYLYTTQYQMGGVVAISLGRVSASNPEQYTHALFMRFQKKENLENFYENPFYLKVLKDHVITYCHGLLNVDYESEVEDDMLSIFRKGEEFNHGVEFVLLISFNEGVLGNLVEHAFASLASVMFESPSLIVQFTL